MRAFLVLSVAAVVGFGVGLQVFSDGAFLTWYNPLKTVENMWGFLFLTVPAGILSVFIGFLAVAGRREPFNWGTWSGPEIGLAATVAAFLLIVMSAVMGTLQWLGGV